MSTGFPIIDEIKRVYYEGIVNALLNIGSLILEFVTNNPLLALCFSGCIVSVACGVVRRVKRTSIR